MRTFRLLRATLAHCILRHFPQRTHCSCCRKKTHGNLHNTRLSLSVVSMFCARQCEITAHTTFRQVFDCDDIANIDAILLQFMRQQLFKFWKQTSLSNLNLVHSKLSSSLFISLPNESKRNYMSSLPAEIWYANNGRNSYSSLSQ